MVFCLLCGFVGRGGEKKFGFSFVSFLSFLKHRKLRVQYLAPKFTWVNSIAFNNVINPRCQAGGEKRLPSGSKAKIINLIST